MDNENIYGTKYVQEYLLGILFDIDKLCRENDIHYSLMGGALLGAIRHKGFIPWDDDVDIIFDRENYNKFLNIAKYELPEDYVFTGSIWVKRITKKDNPGIENEEGCVDLFVFDGIPNNRFISIIKNFTLKCLQGMLKKTVKYDNYSFSYKVLAYVTHSIGKIFSKEIKLKWYDCVCQWGSNENSKHVNNYITYFSNIGKMRYDASNISDFIDYEFENIKVMIFKNYDHFLTTQFGEYMIPVSVDKRKPTHLRADSIWFK